MFFHYHLEVVGVKNHAFSLPLRGSGSEKPWFFITTVVVKKQGFSLPLPNVLVNFTTTSAARGGPNFSHSFAGEVHCQPLRSLPQKDCPLRPGRRGLGHPTSGSLAWGGRGAGAGEAAPAV